MIRNSTIAGLMALSLAAAGTALPAPAEAGGGVRLELTPDARSADAIRMGLGIYSLVRQHKSRARVDQRGSGNSAGVGQSGRGNVAAVFQQGRGHSTSVQQNGDGNAIGIIQFGRNRSSSHVQSGNGNVGLVVEGGW